MRSIGQQFVLDIEDGFYCVKNFGFVKVEYAFRVIGNEKKAPNFVNNGHEDNKCAIYRTTCPLIHVWYLKCLPSFFFFFFWLKNVFLI